MKFIKNLLKWVLLLVVAAFLILFILWLLNAPTPFTDNSASKAKLEQADYSVDTLKLEVIDTSRETAALGEFEGDDKRILTGKIWFPKGSSSGLPLIVYSHGFAGYYNESRHIAEYLARNGYVVAAVNFPLSNRASPAGVPQLVDVVNQPGDVSAVIDHVLRMNAEQNSVLFGRIDGNKIGAMGLSLGGLTTALVSFHPELKDQRIKAVAMMAPPLESFSEQFYMNSPEVNSLLLSGSFDRVVPEIANAIEIQPRHVNGWFLQFDTGTHLGFANIGNQLRWMDNPDNLGCAMLDMMLAKLDLPESWGDVIPNPEGVLRSEKAGDPCPDLPGESMNGLKQQWLSRIAIGSFFDMQFGSEDVANSAKTFFIEQLAKENPELSLVGPE